MNMDMSLTVEELYRIVGQKEIFIFKLEQKIAELQQMQEQKQAAQVPRPFPAPIEKDVEHG